MTIYGAIEKVTHCPACGGALLHHDGSLFERSGEAEIECVGKHRFKVLEIHRDRSVYSFKLAGDGEKLLG